MTTRQSGFSLAELMIAMMVTMMVSGAVFTLMTAGQGAFRREPELTERQQNIRVAMDLIQRDIATGGAGMDPFAQVFSPTDLHPPNTPLNGHGPVGSGTGANSDHLQVFGNDGECPDLPVHPPGSSVNLTSFVPVPNCYGEDQFVVVVFEPPANPLTAWGFAHEIHGNDATKVNFPSGLNPMPGSTIPGTPAWPDQPVAIQRIQLVRYEIAADTDGVPGLWRSVTGGFDSDNEYQAAPAAAGFWQLVARGIEDMQVRYQTGVPGYVNTPPVTAAGAYPTIVKDVEVTLWARAIAQNLQGQRVAAGGHPNAVRGSLVSVTTPRAALMALRDPAAGAAQWR
jgi:type II secretory pathway pseudopilin PulG